MCQRALWLRLCPRPDRLTEPLLRVSANGQATFTSIGWDEALDTVALRLRQIRAEYGPDSIAVLTSAKCTNEENYLLQKWRERSSVPTP